MPEFFGARCIILLVALLPLLSSVVGGGFPASLTLERAFPASRNVELEALRARDRSRHGRILQGTTGVVDFPVLGSADPFAVGLYFTRVKLGSPPKEFYVQIDTGSDILWVSCDGCNGCPKSSGLGIDLQFFSPDGSSTASVVSCSDEICSFAVQTLEAGCSSQSTNSQCNYSFQYGDGSGTAGYYVSDTLYFDTIVGDDATVNSSSSIVFGCSVTQSGDLTKADRAIDGIFGFGQHDLSVVSQLSSKGIAPKVFSHCLKGSDTGGGVLVLGEIMEPGIVYTPLVQSQPHYNLNLQSIAVNGQRLSIDPAVFATSSNRGTIIDSGTTLAYLAEEAYDPFVNAIIAAVSQSVNSFLSKGNQCFVISNSVDEIFPSVALNFEGGASLVLKPEDYLLQQGSVDNAMIWCIGWQKVQGQGVTILGGSLGLGVLQHHPNNVWGLTGSSTGNIIEPLLPACETLFQKVNEFSEASKPVNYTHNNFICESWLRAYDLVLKNKIFVYDLASQRIGWTNYDCSLPVNVSSTSSGKNEFVNAGQLSVSSSPAPLRFVDSLMHTTLVAGFFVHSLMFGFLWL